jgi:hypothetical protein
MEDAVGDQLALFVGDAVIVGKGMIWATAVLRSRMVMVSPALA